MVNKDNCRNNTLDLLKLISAYMVVFIHIPFHGMVGEVIKLFARFAVPIFFMTSGYFCYENDSKRIARKIKKIVGILIFTSILYNFTNVFVEYTSKGVDGIINYIAIFGDIQGWINLLLFNLPFSATRLWFLFALIYVYLLQLLFMKYNVSYKTIFIISSCGLVLHLLLGNVLSIAGINISDYIYRNYLLMGYPFFGFGLLFRHNEEKIHAIHTKIVVVLLLFGTAMSFIPLLYNQNVQLSLGTILFVFTAFLVSLKKDNIKYPVWLLRISDCSLGIYIFHRPVSTIVAKLMLRVNFIEGSQLYDNVLPIIVCLVTTLLTLLLTTLRKLKSKSNHSIKKEAILNIYNKKDSS